MPPKKHIYPVFLPHAGCPFQCVYCNQHAITDQAGQAGIIEKVRASLASYSELIERSGRAGEIAFFGGTFTALPLKLLEQILTAAASCIEKGIFTGIRFSTRPDCLGDDVLGLLSNYPVKTVELGVQSMSDAVLRACGRGYAAEAVRDAAWRVRSAGWELGIQLMAGLPGDSAGIFMESMLAAIDLGPDFFRIYPTLVLEGTALAELFRKGSYKPLTLDEAVNWVVAAYAAAVDAGIPVIRMGLHSDPAIERPDVVLAGPYHPAFGYLVRSRWWRNRLDLKFDEFDDLTGMRVVVRVPKNLVSDIIGHRGANLGYWKATLGISDIKVVGDSGLTGVEILLECYK